MERQLSPKKLRFSLFFLLLFLAALFLSTLLLHQSAEDATFFSRWYTILFLLNGACLIALIGLIGTSIKRLIAQVRRQELGAKLTTKLVVTLIFLAIAPAIFMYIFSLSFLQRGVDSWFDTRIEATLADALTISRTVLNDRMQEIDKKLGQVAQQLEVPGDMDIPEKFKLLLETNALPKNISLHDDSGKTLLTSEDDSVPVLTDTVLTQLKNNDSYLAIEPTLDNNIVIIAARHITHATDSKNYILYQSLLVTERMGILAQRIQEAFSNYQELTFIREPLKDSFILTLSLALLQSLLTAIWAAFYFAQKLVAPIRMLAAGTRAVAVGNYRQQLPEQGNDELSLLVKSFNDMTKRIGQAQAEARANQTRAETQRLYFETVLKNLSSGVITFDYKQRLHTINNAANGILLEDLEKYKGKNLQEIIQLDAPTGELLRHAEKHFENGEPKWSEEMNLVLNSQLHTLMCRGSLLPKDENLHSGYILVFDDVTTLVRAQKDAAWGEVARRLAHEIKNPLTPIQLSAERLRHKYLSKLEDSDAEVLNKSTNTIINQVESMKNMVQAFTDYAKPPKTKLSSLDINKIVREVSELYHKMNNCELALRLENIPLMMMGDADRLRQLMHNLLKNAVEASKQSQTCLITVCTQEKHDRQQHVIELSVEDEGSGIDESMLPNLFEPYVTSKTKGTGLGLAIAKKIVEEHSGQISAYNKEEGGAKFLVRFPLGPVNLT